MVENINGGQEWEPDRINWASLETRPEDAPQSVLEPPDLDKMVTVYDVETGDVVVVYEGSLYNLPPLQAICAEGTYYRD